MRIFWGILVEISFCLFFIGLGFLLSLGVFILK